MKIISALYNKICKLECSCCGEDHYIEFSMPNKKLLDKENFLYLRFKTSEYLLRDRIRISKDVLRRKKQLENKTEVFNSILLDLNQIAELFSILKLEYEQNDLIKPEDIKEEKLKLELLTSSDINFHEYSLFTSNEGLIISSTIEKNKVYDLNLGYSLESEIKFIKLFRKCVKWVFNKKKNIFFEEHEITLSKKEFIKFMSILDIILQRIEEKFENNKIFSHMEIKRCK